MANIKWDNYTIVCTALSNQIVIGKKDNKRSTEGLTLLSDKSGDRTNECVAAVMQYLDTKLKEKEDDNSITATIEGFGTLTWTRFEEE